MVYENCYERGMEIMAQRKGKKKGILKWAKKAGKIFLKKVFPTIAVSGLTILGSYYIQTVTLQVKVDTVLEDVKEIKEDVKTLEDADKEAKSQLSSLQTSYSNLEKRLDRIENLNDNLILKGLANASVTFETNQVKAETYLAQPTWKQGEVIAVDLKTGREYTSDELVSQKVLLSYEENSQEVFFYGQFNENNRWDKDCLINVYAKDKLILVMEAVYDDGELVNYKQIIPDTTVKSKDVWIVSERVVNGDSNVGISQNYYREKEIEKEFDTDSVQESDLITIGKFKENMSSELEAYYYGATSNGKYNDSTGTAYLAKYSKDGSIRTLYVGNFKDGAFEDNTGNAWYIVREDEPGKETNYMYYKGKFKNGAPVNKEVENDLSIEEVQKYISGYKFECELKWFYNGQVLQTL